MSADMPRVRFLLECSRYDVASVSWDAEELEAEFTEPWRELGHSRCL